MVLNHKKYRPGIWRRLGIVALISIVLFFQGCTVKYSFSGATTVGLKTFSVQYFQNRASLVQPGLSQSLTDALIDKCKGQTNLKYVSSMGDVNFEGVITDYVPARPLTVAADAQAAMNRFTIVVQIKYTNTVKPELSFDQSFTRYEDYSSSLTISDIEKEKSDLIIQALVEDIFNQAFVNW